MNKDNLTTQTQVMILSMIIFGTIGICRRFIPLPSEVLAFSRGILGGVFLLLLQRFRGYSFSFDEIGRNAFLKLILTGILIGFNWILLFEAYNATTVAIATLCYYMQPVIVILLSPLVLREKITGKQAVCVAVSVVGMILVSGVTGTAAAGGMSNIRGVGCGLGAAALYASVVLLNKRIEGVPIYEKTMIQLFSASIILIPYMAVTGSLHTYSLEPLGILLLLTVGIVHTGIAYALYFGAVEQLPARTCALLSYIDPVSAVLLSAVFLHEPMGISGMIGTLLIIGAAVTLVLLPTDA